MLDNLLSKYALCGNWVDLAFLIFVIYFILINEGFVSSFFDFLGFIFSFISSLKTYGLFSKLLIANFSLSKGLSNALGFVSAWFVAEIIFFILIKFLLKKISTNVFKSKIKINLGFVPAIFQAGLLFSFILALIVSLPVRTSIKVDILNSKSGPILINFSQKIESSLKPVFKETVTETLNFLTIKQNSEEKVNLEFKLTRKDLKIDSASETAMFNLINNERQSRGIESLTLNEPLSETAREYGEEMFINGFFSHYSGVDNSSPAQRLSRKNIDYLIAGENLAFAPDVQIAHNGLMNSEGHRKNILSPEYRKVGIGVIDGGIFGKIFVQEFTN
jgi:uncharacterized protein YkwD